MGVMREDGEWVGEERFVTSAKELIHRVEEVDASEKELTFEEGPMAQWMAEALRGRVKRLLVCDPRENALIARSAKKRDDWDVRALCRLLRLGELKEVYHPEEMERARKGSVLWIIEKGVSPLDYSIDIFSGNRQEYGTCQEHHGSSLRERFII